MTLGLACVLLPQAVEVAIKEKKKSAKLQPNGLNQLIGPTTLALHDLF